MDSLRVVCRNERENFHSNVHELKLGEEHHILKSRQLKAIIYWLQRQQSVRDLDKLILVEKQPKNLIQFTVWITTF